MVITTGLDQTIRCQGSALPTELRDLLKKIIEKWSLKVRIVSQNYLKFIKDFCKMA